MWPGLTICQENSQESRDGAHIVCINESDDWSNTICDGTNNCLKLVHVLTGIDCHGEGAGISHIVGSINKDVGDGGGGACAKLITGLSGLGLDGGGSRDVCSGGRTPNDRGRGRAELDGDGDVLRTVLDGRWCGVNCRRTGLKIHF